jgi:hypothetical protein
LVPKQFEHTDEAINQVYVVVDYHDGPRRWTSC